MVRLSRPAKTFTPKQGQYLAFIHLYRACTADPRPKPTCSNTSALAHPRFTKWCSRSNARASSEDSQEQPAASNCSLIPNSYPNYFEHRFNRSKSPCKATSLSVATFAIMSGLVRDVVIGDIRCDKSIGSTLCNARSCTEVNFCTSSVATANIPPSKIIGNQKKSGSRPPLNGVNCRPVFLIL